MSASKRSARRSIGPLRLNTSVVEAADAPSSGSSSVVGSVVEEVVMTNDDNAERRERRQHRVIELQPQNVSSPSRDASAGLNRLSMSSGGMPTFSACGLSTTDLGKHYANCIKLSSENKITPKNAFGLHLIDYMAELLKTEHSEMNNFQAYGCTLDASAKIYGYRVDFVHAETQKIASGLSRSDGNKRNLDDSGDGQADGEDPNESVQTKKQKKVNKRNATIEKNLKNINTNKSTDHHSEADPLFRRTTELFTDGGSGGVVLLHALRCCDDNGELVLDSMDALDSGLTVDAALTPAESSQPPFDDAVDCAHFLSILKDVASGENHICPEFAEFNFNQWNLQDGVESSRRLNDTVPTVMDVGDDGAFQEVEPSYQDNYMGEDAAVDDDDVGVETPMLPRPIIPTVMIEQATTDKRDADAAALMNLTIRGLASERNEYSYFKKDFATAWAGPNHLHMRARGLSTTIGRTEPKTRTKKAAFHIEYSENLLEDIASAFRRSKIPTRLTKDTRRKWTYDNTTLVEDSHYEIETLQQLFLKKSVKIRQKKPINQSADADLQNYDYHNQNDVENFCPAIDVVDNAGRMSTTSGASDAAFSPASRGFPESNFGDLDTQLGGSQDVPAVGQNAILAFTGDNLIQQPRKVGTFEVPHMRAAKRVNVRRLKESIWTLLKEGNSLQDIASEERAPTPDGAKKEQSFNDIYRQLSSHLSVENAANLTYPMAFVCALHITNEKNLELIPQKDMKDFKIYLPPDGGANAS